MVRTHGKNIKTKILTKIFKVDMNGRGNEKIWKKVMQQGKDCEQINGWKWVKKKRLCNNGKWIFDDNEVQNVFLIHKNPSPLSLLSHTGQGQPPCVDLREGDLTHGGVLHPQHCQFLRPELPQESPQSHSDSGKEACAGLMFGQM